MLISLFSLVALGTPILAEKPAPAEQLPEIKIRANNREVEVRIGDCKITGNRITIDQKLQRIVVEGGGTLVKFSETGKDIVNTSTGKKIAYDLVNKKYTVYATDGK